MAKGESERKRKIEDEVESSDDEFTVDGLIDVQADDESGESEAEEDSDTELNALIGEEEEEDEDSGTSSVEFDEPAEGSFTDRLANLHIRSLSQGSGDVKVGKFSDGSERLIKPEIDPVYDSDDSDADNFNTIGNIPLDAYEEFPHIGYDINGKRIMRPAKGSALEQLLDQIDLPEGWTGLLDSNTGSSLNLTQEEIDLIEKIEQNKSTDDSINPYEATIEWFTSEVEVMPLTATPEPKRRFVPSKHEAKRIMKIVRAIREGRISLDKEAQVEEESYDLWGESEAVEDHIMTLRAPKVAPPTHDESYNPPGEYLPTDEEIKKWEEAEPMDRERNFLPKKFGSLRKVPGYEESLRERFERSLDLYLAPRVRHNKLQIDPESLVPELPSPKDLRPFPIRCSTEYLGHKGKVRTLSVDPSGLWLATGSDDGTVKFWEVLTGREVYSIKVVEDDEDKVECVSWNPDGELGILAACVGESVFLISPPIFGFDIENQSRLKLEAGFGYNTYGNVKKTGVNVDDEDDVEAPAKKSFAQWIKPSEELLGQGAVLQIECRKTVKSLSWHRKGDYFVTVSPESANSAVLIHQLSKHSSQSPFKKSKGIISDVKFHPFRPQIFVCSQRYIKVYDLAQQVMVKKLMPGARWLSKVDIHPRGDHLIASSFDKRVLWHDLDTGATPYKTLRYHEKAVRQVQFHKSLPLFCSASDDGSIHVMHATVYDDLMTNPLLVPLKKLTGHKVKESLGVLDVVWHPKEAWVFSCGADGVAKLWTT